MEMVRQLASVLFVLGLLGFLLWVLRRRNLAQFRFRAPRGRKRKVLERLERLPLSPQHSLYLVRIGDRVVVLAAHSAGCTLLDCRPARELAPAPPSDVPVATGLSEDTR